MSIFLIILAICELAVAYRNRPKFASHTWFDSMVSVFVAGVLVLIAIS